MRTADAEGSDSQQTTSTITGGRQKRACSCCMGAMLGTSDIKLPLGKYVICLLLLNKFKNANR